jgi:hypothetical protein
MTLWWSASPAAAASSRQGKEMTYEAPAIEHRERIDDPLVVGTGD